MLGRQTNPITGLSRRSPLTPVDLEIKIERPVNISTHKQNYTEIRTHREKPKAGCIAVRLKTEAQKPSGNWIEQ